MSKLMYELKPWFCIMFAAVALINVQGSKLGYTFSFLLMGCGLLILQWRFEYRKQLKNRRY